MRERRGFDLHVHSEHSLKDSGASFDRILDVAGGKGLGGIAITDHDVVSEALLEEKRAFEKKYGISIIIGEEIKTKDLNEKGKEVELVGLGIDSAVDPGLSVGETIYQIRDRGGIVVIPHPFDEWRHGAGEKWSRWIINLCLDELKVPVAIEVLNARAPRWSNRKAEKLWKEFKDRGVLRTAGSDAHWPGVGIGKRVWIGEVGRAYVGILDFRNKDEFLGRLSEAEIYGRDNAVETAFYRLVNRMLLLGRQGRRLNF